MEKCEKLKKLEQLKKKLHKKKRKLQKIESLTRAKEHVKKTIEEQNYGDSSNASPSSPKQDFEECLQSRFRSKRVRFSSSVNSPKHHGAIKRKTSNTKHSAFATSQKHESQPSLRDPSPIMPRGVEKNVAVLSPKINSDDQCVKEACDSTDECSEISQSILHSMASQSESRNSPVSKQTSQQKVSGIVKAVENSDVVIESPDENSVHEEQNQAFFVLDSQSQKTHSKCSHDLEFLGLTNSSEKVSAPVKYTSGEICDTGANNEKLFVDNIDIKAEKDFVQNAIESKSSKLENSETFFSDPLPLENNAVKPKSIKKSRRSEVNVLDFSFLEEDENDMYSQIKNRRRKTRARSPPGSLSRDMNFPLLYAGLSQTMATHKDRKTVTTRKNDNIPAAQSIFCENGETDKTLNRFNTQSQLSENKSPYVKSSETFKDIEETIKTEPNSCSQDLFHTQVHSENPHAEPSVVVYPSKALQEDSIIECSKYPTIKFPEIPVQLNTFKEFFLPQNDFVIKAVKGEKISNSFEQSDILRDVPNNLRGTIEIAQSDVTTNGDLEILNLQKCNAAPEAKISNEKKDGLDKEVVVHRDFVPEDSQPIRKLSSSRGRRCRKKKKNADGLSCAEGSCTQSTCESGLTGERTLDSSQANTQKSEQTTTTVQVSQNHLKEQDMETCKDTLEICRTFELQAEVVCIDNGTLSIGEESVGIIAMVTDTMLYIYGLDGHKICSAEAETGEKFLEVCCVQINSGLIVVTKATNGVAMVINSVILGCEQPCDMFIQCLSLRKEEQEKVVLTPGSSHLIVAHITARSTSIYDHNFTSQNDVIIDTNHMTPVQDCLHSICLIQDFAEAVVGVSASSVHIWDRIQGTLLKSINTSISSSICCGVYNEQGVLFLVVWEEKLYMWSILALNPCMSRSCVIMTSRDTSRHGFVKQVSLYEDLMCSLHENGSALVWNIHTAEMLCNVGETTTPSRDETHDKNSSTNKNMHYSNDRANNILSYFKTSENSGGCSEIVANPNDNVGTMIMNRKNDRVYDAIKHARCMSLMKNDFCVAISRENNVFLCNRINYKNSET